MPLNSNFRLPRGHWFFAKNRSYGYGANYGGDPLGSILGPMGSHWVQKMALNRKKLPCPKIRIFDYPAVIDFSQKMEVTVMAPNHGGDTLRSILGPMGSHWVQEMGQNRKKNYHASILEFSTTPRSTIFRKKWKLQLWRQISVGTPYGPSWGQWGPIGSKKWVKAIKKYHAPNFEFSTTPRSSIFTKNEVTVMAPNHGGDPPGAILWPMGSHWVQKMGQSHKKLPCPKFRIFHYPPVIDFSQRMENTVMAPNHGGDPLGSILGSMGTHWVQKIGQNRKK